MIVLGLDPGFAMLGYAVVELGDRAEEDIVRRVWTVETEKSAKKKGVFAAHDDIRRGRELHRALSEVMADFSPVAICAEIPSGSKGARAGACLAAAKQALASFAEQHELPVLCVSPTELKQAVTGKGTASKEEVQRALEGIYGEIEWPRLKGHHEHAADALGAYRACETSELMRMLRQMVRKGIA